MGYKLADIFRQQTLKFNEFYHILQSRLYKNNVLHIKNANLYTNICIFEYKVLPLHRK